MVAKQALVAATFSQTATRVLDIAERLVQTRGFNGFSYADISAELGITKASIHHHFPTKAELGSALVVRYHSAFFDALQRIDDDAGSSRVKLERYRQLYTAVLMNDNRMCLCGMLAADFTTLPESMRTALTAFFDANERWLAAVLEDGRSAGALRFEGDPGPEARLLVSALEGAMLVARSYCDPERFAAVADRIFAQLIVPERGPRKAARPSSAGAAARKARGRVK
jgi:TetR/AcrR family transcriptional repressor of nem operon